MGDEMARLQAEFYTKAPEPIKRKKVMFWAIPEGLSLDEAKAAAKARGEAAGYRVTSANFRRDPVTGDTAAIVIYVERQRKV
jgi:hypothetical protein